MKTSQQQRGASAFRPARLLHVAVFSHFTPDRARLLRLLASGRYMSHWRDGTSPVLLTARRVPRAHHAAPVHITGRRGCRRLVMTKRKESVWWSMSTRSHHSAQGDILKRFLESFLSTGTIRRRRQHLVPLWPLSSSGPRERDSYLSGLITGGVHFTDVHADEMKG